MSAMFRFTIVDTYHFVFYSCLRDVQIVGWLVVLGLTALWDNISVYIGPSPKEREKEEKG